MHLTQVAEPNEQEWESTAEAGQRPQWAWYQLSTVLFNLRSHSSDKTCSKDWGGMAHVHATESDLPSVKWCPVYNPHSVTFDYDERLLALDYRVTGGLRR